MACISACYNTLNWGAAMSEDLAEELEQVETELAEKLAEATRVGDCLVVLGNRLKREPWQWVLGGHPNPHRDAISTLNVESVINSALDRKHMKKLLEEIRNLRNRKENLERRFATKVKYKL